MVDIWMKMIYFFSLLDYNNVDTIILACITCNCNINHRIIKIMVTGIWSSLKFLHIFVVFCKLKHSFTENIKQTSLRPTIPKQTKQCYRNVKLKWDDDCSKWNAIFNSVFYNKWTIIKLANTHFFSFFLFYFLNKILKIKSPLSELF